MNISSTASKSLAPLALQTAPKAATKATDAAPATQAPADTVEINTDKDASDAETKKLLGKTKVAAIAGAVIGAVAGAAAGIAGGAMGAIVGLAVAPAGLVAGAVGGAVGGFHSAKLIAETPDGATYLGIALGLGGIVVGGMAGFYGGAFLGAAAGAAGGLMGAAGGVVGGATVGTAVSGLGKIAYELTANKSEYPNLRKELEEDAAKEAAKES